MGPFAELGEKYIEAGYGAVPIVPGTKKPGCRRAGCWMGLPKWSTLYDSGAPADHLVRMWSAGDTGIGILGGHRDLVAVDIDSDDDALRRAIDAVLPPSPVVKRGAKGETRFYYGPGVASQSFDIAGRRVVDVIGRGRQTVLPPTLHPDTGEPYRWTGHTTLLEIDPEDLPELPADIGDAIAGVLAPFGWRPGAAPRPAAVSGDGDSPARRLNDMAMARLEAWVPALNLYKCRAARGGFEAIPVWRPSTTGRPSEKRSRNLGINPQGIRDFGADQGYTPIDLVMAADGCDFDTAFRFLAERLGFGDGIDVAGLVPAETQSGAAPALPAQASGTRDGPVEEARSPAPGGAGVGPAASLTPHTHNVPGVVGQIIEWVTASARRPNRIAALATALVVVGTLIGRRAATPTRSGTHLYLTLLGPTGAGKQHAHDCATELLYAANAGSHIGASEYFSLSGLHRMLTESPLTLCLQDEFGAFLRSVTHARASSWEASANRMLRQAWGASYKRLGGVQWARDRTGPIWCPALSIFGLSTPDEFYQAVQGDSVSNGFLNRMLVFDMGPRSEPADPSVAGVPPRIAQTLSELYLWSGPDSLLSIGDATAQVAPDVLPWADIGAREAYADFERVMNEQSDNQPGLSDFYSRCAEQAARLATIRAAGRWGPGAGVDTSDIEWAAAIVWTAGQALASAVQGFIPENERSRFVAALGAWIRRKYEQTGKPVTRRQIQHRAGGRVKSADVKDMIGHLVDTGEITADGNGFIPMLGVLGDVG